MHIIKRTPEVKRHIPLLVTGGMMYCLSVVAYANEDHEHHMMEMNQSAQPISQIHASSVPTDHLQHDISSPMPQHKVQHQSHDHHREHGGQLYQATSLENAWLVDEYGQGRVDTELKTWVGTDENKLFIKAHVEKRESEQTQTEAMALYSRNVADFWDLQAGMRYRYQPEQQQDKNQWHAVVGLHGLAPYFFETEAYLYAGQEKRWQFSLETSRDLLFTQKLIAQPYLNVDWVLSDDSKYSQKTGLSKLQTGLQIRYEITKNVMPFIDVAYIHHKGRQETEWQTATQHEQGGLYGAGLTLKF